MIENPWSDLARPASGATVSARRVDPTLAWGFFWGRGADGRCLLILRHSTEASPTSKLPLLKGIETSLSDSETAGTRVLMLRLLDAAQRDIFHELCLNIVASTATAASEVEAVSRALHRTWRWHHLLRGGVDGRLSLEEQKGVIGELLVLERLLMPRLSTADAVTAWRGPLGAPKDFEVGRVCIEAKARRGAARPYIAISSEHQLTADGTDALFLHVIELNQAPSGTANAIDLSGMVRRLHTVLSAADSAAGDVFDQLVSATGFRWEDDYTDSPFIVGASHIYLVSDGFPSITPSMMPAGVLNVRYSVSLPDCEPFRVPRGSFDEALAGQENGH